MKKNTYNPMLIIPVKDGVILPNTEVLLSFDKDSEYIKHIIQAEKNRSQIVILFQPSPAKPKKPEDIQRVGTQAEIIKTFFDNNLFNVLVRGLKKIKIETIYEISPVIIGSVADNPDIEVANDDILAMRMHLRNILKEIATAEKNIDYLVILNLEPNLDTVEFIYKLTGITDIKPNEKQGILEENNLEQKLRLLNEHLSHKLQIINLEQRINEKTQEKITKTARDALLRERLDIIEKELGIVEGTEYEDLRKKISEAKMPKDVTEKAEKELNRLIKMPTYNPESSYIQSYLSWLTDLPWSRETSSNIDLVESKRILDADHYGLEQIKERIIEYLAVLKLKSRKSDHKKQLTNILCFVGPPGVGKTSIGKSIANALGRKFISISLGGVKDEAEIKGHRRTYVGALPGRIIQGIKNAGTKNPVFMIDEIDKIGSSYIGDPSASLLEVLDPEQNYHFSDNYLEVPFDLSDVFFIATCNILDTIPPALRDRMEIIRFSGYTEIEKLNIAKKFLLSKQIEKSGLLPEQIKIPDQTLREIIRSYTREAGVRDLERNIAQILRKTAIKVVEKKARSDIVKPSDLQEYLGAAKFKQAYREQRDNIGITPALGWSEVGGIVLSVEATSMPGKGNLILTGQLGDIMKESCQAALSFIRSNAAKFNLEEDFYSKKDIHIHVPEGAIQKDGPSAGIAIVIALISLLTKTEMPNTIAMTGEITLRGRILEVGGIKEKLIAANLAGFEKVIIPEGNVKDIVDLPDETKRKLEIIASNNIGHVIDLVLPDVSKNRKIA